MTKGGLMLRRRRYGESGGIGRRRRVYRHPQAGRGELERSLLDRELELICLTIDLRSQLRTVYAAKMEATGKGFPAGERSNTLRT